MTIAHFPQWHQVVIIYDRKYGILVKSHLSIKAELNHPVVG